MIYTRNELPSNLCSSYQLNKALADNRLFKLSSGLYSESDDVDTLEIIVKKYPNAIFNKISAFSFWNLTDHIPDKFYLATSRDSTRINSSFIKQTLVQDNLFLIGKTSIVVSGLSINIYDKERLLIDLVGSKSKLPYDYYKEIIFNYRNNIESISANKINKYLKNYKYGKQLHEKIYAEVF